MEYSWFRHYPAWVKREIDSAAVRPVHHILESACGRFGDNPAFTCMGSTITYRRWNELAERFAAYLQHGAGLRQGDRLAIMVPNLLQFPVVFFAAQKLGLVCICTNPLYSPREMKHQFKDSGAKALIIADIFLGKLAEILEQTEIKTVIATGVGDFLPLWKRVGVHALLCAQGFMPQHSLTVMRLREALRYGSRHSAEKPRIDIEDTCVLQYTGGTTGDARGAMLSHRNIVSNVEMLRMWAAGSLRKDSQETVLTALPLYHIFALTVNFLTFLVMGHHLILVPKPTPPKNMVKVFKRYPISALTGVNTLYNALNHEEEFRRLAPRGIRLAIAGGMPLNPSVAQEWQQITGSRIVEGFGMTETSPVTHVNPLDGNDREGSIGLPLPSTEARIVSEAGEDLPVGEVGELIIRGPQVMKGYWKHDEATKNTVKNGWMFTGDMGRCDKDGFFYLVERKKDMVLVSGFNVFPKEVEGILCSHPKVKEAAVIGIPDSRCGEAVKAFIVAKDPSLSVEELRDHCHKELAGYKRPRFYEFRDELPKTNVGKVLKRVLKEAELQKLVSET